MTIKTPITSLTVSDETKVLVPKGGVLIFFGPNNVGKSLALREILSHLTRRDVESLRVVKAISIDKDSSEPEFVEWVEKNCNPDRSEGGRYYSHLGRGALPLDDVVSYWRSGPPYGELGHWFIFFAGAEERLQGANAVSTFDRVMQVPSHPLHFLYEDPQMEQQISDLCKQVFREPLTLNRNRGSMISLHVGQEPSAFPNSAPPTREYLEHLNTLPTLDEQGDGMRSFMGLMLNVMASSYPFILVDEPEAFLHPPRRAS